MTLSSFISYTTREDEIKQIKPFIDRYLKMVEERFSREFPFFYDGVHVPIDPCRSEHELASILSKAIYKCDFTTAFTSPGYVTSDWCVFEWRTSRNKTRDQQANILPIMWKEHDLHIFLVPPEFERQYVYLPIYEEIERRDFETALEKAVEETIKFIRRYHWPPSIRTKQ